MVLTLVLAAVAPAASAVDHASRLSDLSVQRQPDGTPRFNLAGQSLNADQLADALESAAVPPAFWWMSLGGAAMLLAYFAWRKDIVGLIGQGTGFLIYARNLWLLRRAKAASPSP